MTNPCTASRVVSFVLPLAAALCVTACGAMQSSGSGKTAGVTPPKTTPKPPPTSASGVYSVTFGVSARTSRLGAVQFDAKAKSSGGWQGAGASVACQNISGAAMMACNNKGGGLLSCALIDQNGIATPRDLVTCRFTAAKPVGAGDFSVKVTDASSPDMKPVNVNIAVTKVTGH